MAKIHLNEISTKAPEGFDKRETREKMIGLKEELDELQNLLYAENKHALLVIFQGLDASGKDGAIRKVFGGLNPMGVSAFPFKVPSEEEASHDFLWRIHKVVPARGRIHIFNRSQYEDVLVTRVHGLCDDETAKKRMEAINDFEQLLEKNNNTVILKFYLHISQEEQLGRLKERVEIPRKKWKFNERDLEESKFWPKYMKMYEEVFDKCNKIPWTIVPSDQNWYKEYVIATKVKEVLEGLRMEYPLIR